MYTSRWFSADNLLTLKALTTGLFCWIIFNFHHKLYLYNSRENINEKSEGFIIQILFIGGAGGDDGSFSVRTAQDRRSSVWQL